jgi:hypothetical protein
MGFATKAFQLRPARSDDFRFAWSLYEELMMPLTVELLGRWNKSEQRTPRHDRFAPDSFRCNGWAGTSKAGQ